MLPSVSPEYRRELIVTVIAILLASLLMVALNADELPPWPSKEWLYVLLFYTAFAGGPLTGWLFAIQGGVVVMGLTSLVPLTIFSVWPLLHAAIIDKSTSRRVCLAIGAAFWVFSGYFYLIALWT